MSKQAYIARYLFIIRFLRSQPYATFEDIQWYTERQFEYLQEHDDRLFLNFSLRTLQRDIREIRTIYGIDIAYSRVEQGYYIRSDAGESRSFYRMLEAFDLFQALNRTDDLAPYVHFDHGSPQGTEYLHPLLFAIKERRAIRFSYLKFHETVATRRFVDPLAIKEYRNRWYLLARERATHDLKTFGLDRISGLERSGDVFDYPKEYNVNEHFRHSFGIVNPSDAAPERVVLSFTPFQGKYVRTLPLHASQQIERDDEHEFRVALTLRITEDFIMELLSHGDHVTVLEPESLRLRMEWSLSRALKNYQQ